jgi:hypothetical protein
VPLLVVIASPCPSVITTGRRSVCTSNFAVAVIDRPDNTIHEEEISKKKREKGTRGDRKKEEGENSRRRNWVNVHACA